MSLPARLFGRCSGVLVASFQTPCRSGSPHGVFVARHAFGAGFAGAFDAALSSAFGGSAFFALPPAWPAIAGVVASAKVRIAVDVRIRYGIDVSSWSARLTSC